MSANQFAESFKKALLQTEETRDPQPVAGLFQEGAQLSNLAGDHGTDARAFWQQYLEQFKEIRSEFTSAVTGDGAAALEWKSRGLLKDGRPAEYRGVSVIEFDENGLTGFRAYYDSAAFVRAEASPAA